MNRTVDPGAEGTTFDHTIKVFASGRSRRNVMRGVAAGFLAVASGGIATDTLAKKRKPKPKPKKPPLPTPPPICPLRTSIVHLSVVADGSQTFTPILEAGRNYILRAYGYWSTNGDYMCDAFAAFLWKDGRSPVLYHNGVRLGLAINGESPDLWGPYSQSHTYEFGVIGKGKPISLQMLDSVYSDNGRHLYVEVLCGAPPRD